MRGSRVKLANVREDPEVEDTFESPRVLRTHDASMSVWAGCRWCARSSAAEEGVCELDEFTMR
jgi:hypothetical protein